MQKRKGLKEIFLGLKLSQRLVLVFSVGCLLPVLCVFFYSYFMSRSILVDQYVQNVSDELEICAANIEAAMSHAEELCFKLSFDPVEEHLVLVGNDARRISVGYQDYDVLKEYLAAYYPEVSEVRVYLTGDHLIDNRHFKLLTDTIREKIWFSVLAERPSGVAWSYSTNVQTDKKSLRISRYHAETNQAEEYIICVTLAESLTADYLANEDSDGKLPLLILNGNEVVNGKLKIADDKILALLKDLPSEERFELDWDDTRYAATQAKIYSTYTRDYYTLLSLIPYNSLVSDANVMTLKIMLPLLASVAFTVVVIVLLSNWFNRRLGAFSSAMHEAAEGNHNGNHEAEIGSARDEIYDCYHDLESMIADIKKLTEAEADARLKQEQIYSRQKDVELKMLATQINPHFLYNTLENIHMLACIGNQPEIEEISVALTQFLRKSLSVGNTLQTVAWEMEMVESYIKIQNYRFGDRITATVHYDKEKAAHYLIMPFVIQPFVENAYVHAMEEVDEGGVISVEATFGEDVLTLHISDNGHGMDAETLKEIMDNLNDTEHLDRTHIGICNVNQRIRLKYGEKYGVNFGSVEGAGTNVEITMPLQENLE